MTWGGPGNRSWAPASLPVHGARGTGISAPGRPTRPTSRPRPGPPSFPVQDAAALGALAARLPRVTLETVLPDAEPTPAWVAGPHAAGLRHRHPRLCFPRQPTRVHAHPVRELHRGRRTCAATVSLPRPPACDKFRAGPRPRATAPPAARRRSAARSGVPALDPAHRRSPRPRAPPPAVLESRACAGPAHSGRTGSLRACVGLVPAGPGNPSCAKESEKIRPRAYLTAFDYERRIKKNEILNKLKTTLFRKNCISDTTKHHRGSNLVKCQVGKYVYKN